MRRNGGKIMRLYTANCTAKKKQKFVEGDGWIKFEYVVVIRAMNRDRADELLKEFFVERYDLEAQEMSDNGELDPASPMYSDEEFAMSAYFNQVASGLLSDSE
jgi:hypothetical protein